MAHAFCTGYPRNSKRNVPQRLVSRAGLPEKFVLVLTPELTVRTKLRSGFPRSPIGFFRASSGRGQTNTGTPGRIFRRGSRYPLREDSR